MRVYVCCLNACLIILFLNARLFVVERAFSFVVERAFICSWNARLLVFERVFTCLLDARLFFSLLNAR